jgi:hypothetical protein
MAAAMAADVGDLPPTSRLATAMAADVATAMAADVATAAMTCHKSIKEQKTIEEATVRIRAKVAKVREARARKAQQAQEATPRNYPCYAEDSRDVWHTDVLLQMRMNEVFRLDVPVSTSNAVYLEEFAFRISHKDVRQWMKRQHHHQWLHQWLHHAPTEESIINGYIAKFLKEHTTPKMFMN